MQRGQGMLLFTWKRIQTHATMLRRLTNYLVFNDFFLCLFWHIVKCKEATDYLVLCIALHTYSHSMSRRDGRGVGEVVIVTKSKRKRLWGQLMSVHCGGIIPLHFNKLVARQRF